MERPPCCDKAGVKKGPWTPEEDIILVSYIKEHGPGNWRSVPTNTGLRRCSKSCRLRWTNYLRPGIKRGNFTPHEERTIIHLQALLGNKWAAIASYLPLRTDNDIKNYWNTHLKKKIRKFQMALELQTDSAMCQFASSKSFTDRDNIADHVSSSSTITTASSTLMITNNSSLYSSSAENISRLLEGWMRSSQKTTNPPLKNEQPQEQEVHFDNNNNNSSSIFGINCEANTSFYRPNITDVVSNEEFEFVMSFDNFKNSFPWDKYSSCDSTHDQKGSAQTAAADETTAVSLNEQKEMLESASNNNNPPHMSFLEKWFLDEAVGQVEEVMEIPSVF